VKHIACSLALGFALATAGSLAAAAATPTGTLVSPEAFQPVPLARSFQNDKVRDALGYDDEGPVRAYDTDLDGDGKPERFIVGTAKLCGDLGCPFALLDGRTQKDIGSFFGTLIVLDRKDRGWAVVQTLGKGDEVGLSNLTTYTFQGVQYQPDDSALVDAAGFDALMRTLRRRP
jgi:hypothetical protein